MAIEGISEKNKLIQIPLKNIDLSSTNHDRYLFNYGRDLNTMLRSVKEVGLINPVIVRKSRGNDRSYAVVCGYQRIKVYQEIGFDKIEGKVLEGISEEEILMLSLHDNLFSRGFNEIEKAIVLKKFIEIGFPYNRLTSEITPLLTIPPKKSIIDDYISLLSLQSKIKKSVAKKELELDKAFLLIKLDDVERDIVCRILYQESSINLNEAKEAVRNLLDLTLIKQQGMAEILSSGEISRILIDSKFNKKQKGERICRILKLMRYPVISRKEGEFENSCRELGLDNDVRVNHSRYFEGDEIRITLKTSNEDKLKLNLEKLLSNVKSGAFKKIFSLFQ